MIPSEWREERDLRAVALAALIGVVVAVIAPPAWLRAIPMLAFVLALPGYAICVALLPSRSLPALDRSLLVVATSISATALGALVVQLVFDLGRLSWALSIALITWAACAWAGRRRAALRSDRAAPDVREAAAARAAPAPRAPAGVGALGALAFVTAAAIAAAAIAVASNGADEQRAEARLAEFSAVPSAIAPGLPPDQVELGVQNDEAGSVDYLLRLRRSGGSPVEWEISLDPHQRWERTVPLAEIPGEGRLLITLHRDGALYRRLDVEDLR